MALQKKTYQPPATTTKRTEGGPAPRSQGGEEYNQATESPSSAADAAISEAKDYSAPDPGTYEAILHSVKMLPLNDKGQSIRAEFVVGVFNEDGELEGQRFSRLFKILEADGVTPSKAIQFYGTFMAKMGYPRENRGEAARAELTEQQPGVSLKIQENNNPQYPPNATVINRLSDDNENIAALREWLEANPF
jgi:hypothetical protein